MHFHRDLLIICRRLCEGGAPASRPDNVFISSPPLAFTFGLGGLAIFPLRSEPLRRCWKTLRRPT